MNIYQLFTSCFIARDVESKLQDWGGGVFFPLTALSWVWVKKFQAEEILLPYIGRVHIYIAINNVQIDSHVLNFSYISTWFVVEPKICQFQIFVCYFKNMSMQNYFLLWIKFFITSKKLNIIHINNNKVYCVIHVICTWTFPEKKNIYLSIVLLLWW